MGRARVRPGSDPVTVAHDRGRLSPRQLALLAAFGYFLFVGGSRAGSLTAIRMIDALLGAVIVALWLRAMFRSTDLADVLTLGAVLLFLVTCLTSTLPRFSFDSATTVLAYAALFGLARRELRSEHARLSTVRFLSAVATVFVVIIGVVWVGQWIQWIQASGGRLPPLEMALSNLGIYTFKYPVAIFIAMLLPLVAAQRSTRGIGLLAYPVLVLGVCLIAMSGARSAWSGAVVGALVMAARPLHLRTPRVSRTTALVGIAVAAVAFAVLITFGAAFAHRALNPSTVSLRLNIWQYSLSQLGDHPLVGSGPGTFPSLITESGFFQGFDNVARGPDSSPVQILAEQGLLGALAVAALVAGFIVAMRHHANRWTRPALASVAVFAVSSVTNDTVHVAQLVGLACVLAALAGPSKINGNAPVPAPGRRARATVIRLATCAAAIVVGAAVSLMQVAAVLHAQAASASAHGDAAAALQRSEAASTLDPRNGYLLQQLGLARLADGDETGALAAFERAVTVSPADVSALRAAALVASDLGRHQEAVQLAARAVELRPSDPTQGLTLALVQAQAGSQPAAAAALVSALQWSPWLPGAPEWPGEFPTGADLTALLRTVVSQPATGPADRTALQRTWLASAAGQASNPDDPTLAGIAALFGCDIPDAEHDLAAGSARDFSTKEILLSAMLANLTGDAAAVERTWTLGMLRAPSTGWLVKNIPGGISPYADTDVVRLYGLLELSIVPPPQPVVPTSNEALAHWMADAVETAKVAAPDSGLASCSAR